MTGLTSVVGLPRDLDSRPEGDLASEGSSGWMDTGAALSLIHACVNLDSRVGCFGGY